MLNCIENSTSDNFVVLKIKKMNFIIPQKSRHILLHETPNKAEEIAQFEANFGDESVLTKSQLFVSLSQNEHLLRVFNSNGHILFEADSDCKLLSVSGNTVFLAGAKNSSPCFFVLETENNRFELTEIKMDLQGWQRKEIDDILVSESEVVLLDNIIVPKFLLLFDRTGLLPNNLKICRLPTAGTYEHIVKGDLSENRLVIFSSTMGRSGYKEHLSIWKIHEKKVRNIIFEDEKPQKQSLREYLIEKLNIFKKKKKIRNFPNDFFRLSFSEKYVKDFVLRKNLLFVLTKNNQILKLNLAEKGEKISEHTLPTGEDFEKIMFSPHGKLLVFSPEKYLFTDFS
jgi:hypothetical protein